MALKKRIKYNWRVFIPQVILIWLIVGVMGVWMYHQERELRMQTIREQVIRTNHRIVYAYEKNKNLEDYYEFISDYYSLHPLYSDIRLTVYYNGRLQKSVGEPILPSETRLYDEDRTYSMEHFGREVTESNEANIYYNRLASNDKRLVVYALLPFDSELIAATQASKSLFVVMIVLALFGTAISWLMSRRLGRNITTLQMIAERASTDPDFVPNMKFPNDELGDISRHIVTFYNQRSASIIKLKREHLVAYHALEDKARLKRELTNNINHELKTPISVIKGYLDTINEHPDMDEGSRNHFLKKVGEHVDRLIQLLNDLSSITRLEEGSQMISTEPVDFHEIVFQAVTDYETSGVLHGMEFNYDVPTYCRVIGNVSLLTAMINNLTKNAVAYSKGTACYLILTDKDDHFFHFAFYDNGVGVKPESLPHLFDRFFREDNGRSRKRGGTGLGLSIVQNTVEALGGTISVDNRSGGGLIFRFSLRRADEEK